MKILWFSWKDISHPLAGGAEVVADEIGRRLSADGHNVTFLVGGYKDCKHTDTHNGYNIIRVGGRLSVYYQAYKYYKSHLAHKHFDIIIEEVNTIPFFTKFYIGQKSKVIKSKSGPAPDLQPASKSVSTFRPDDLKTFQHFMLIHQMARVIWFHEMPFPISLVGYLIEPIYMWLLRSMRVITVSLSTRRDIMRFGFKEENISIISEGVHLKPVADIDSIKKYEHPTMFTIGRIVSMKRIPHIIKAFEIARKRLPHLQLIIAGGNTSTYGKYITSLASRSKYARDIQVTGRISEEKKHEIMERSHVLAVTSVKEDWGLVVTEAGRCGTPSVVYDIDGLRDSVRNGVSGLITQKNTPESFAHSIVELLQIVPSTKLKVDEQLRVTSDELQVGPLATFNSQLATFNYSSSPSQYYSAIRKNAWEFSKEITFEKQYEDFKYITGITPKKYPYTTLIF